MEADAGHQIAFYEKYEDPFHQYQFMSDRGCERFFGAKQGSLAGKFNLDSTVREENECRSQTQCAWEGFSLMPHYASDHENSHDDLNVRHVKGTELRLNINESSTGVGQGAMEPKRKQNLVNVSSPTGLLGLMNGEGIVDEDAENLSLKLCPGTHSYADDFGNWIRNNKRHCSSSPGFQSPVCQVKDCRVDLKEVKDYHRRHKVCEMHSKAPHCIVHGVMQRFCQQCSRFHPLEEFDEGKRSCRRRLAGHNKRRRKPHPEFAVNSAGAVKSADLLRLIAALSQLEARAKEKLEASNKEQDPNFQGLKRLNLLAPTVAPMLLDSALKPSQEVASGIQRSGHESPAQKSLSPEALMLMVGNVLGVQKTSREENAHGPQMPQQPNHDDLSLLSQGNVKEVGCIPKGAGNSVVNGVKFHQTVPFTASCKSACMPPSHSQPKNLDAHQPGGAACAILDSNSESSLEMTCTRIVAERNFFLTASESGSREESQGRKGAVNISELLNNSERPSCPPSDISESGSDQSSPSPSSDEQVPNDSRRFKQFHSKSSPDFWNGIWQQVPNGRICFKLFDPNCPPDFPDGMRLQIQSWLSCAPSNMEHYLRPGCVLLTIFLGISSHAYEELVTNLCGSLRRLLDQASSKSWLLGRILVQVENERALIFNGKVRALKVTRLKNPPILKSVRPLAVVAGQRTTLVVSGQNLCPQTKIVCVYHGRYIVHQVSFKSDVNSHGENCEPNLQEISFPGGPANVFGRCFIEVEHDLVGNFLPLIVADCAICSELCTLERELDSTSRRFESSGDSCSLMPSFDKEADVTWFLHELGWIFENSSKLNASHSFKPCYVSQLEFLRFPSVLRFAVLHDLCAVVKKLLDLLFIMGDGDFGSPNSKIVGVLSEMNLVHQAVKKKCRPMVELLLQYTPDGKEWAGKQVFMPTSKGPLGFTPLHVVANISGAEDILDALTSDPNKAGLLAWRNVCDSWGKTPEWHALNSGNLSYVALVECKLSIKQLQSVNIAILDMPEKLESRKSSVHASYMNLQRPSFKNCGGWSRTRGHKLNGLVGRPMLLTVVAVATVCAAVALYFKGPPRLQSVMYSLMWEGFDYGPL